MSYNDIISNKMSATLHIIPEEYSSLYYIHWYIDYEYFNEALNLRTTFRTSYKTSHDCSTLLNISIQKYLSFATEIINDIPYYVTKIDTIHAIEQLLTDITDFQTAVSFKANDLTVDENNYYYDIVETDLITWQEETNYPINILTIYNGIAYKSTRAHISNNFDEDFQNGNWRQIFTVVNVEPEKWIENKNYKVEQFVLKDSIIYRCINEHTSENFNILNWQEIHNCVSYTDNIELYQPDKEYQLYDVVIYNKRIYICINSSLTFPDGWKLLYATANAILTWKENTKYNLFDMIDMNGTVYVCIQEHTSSYSFQNDISLWKRIPMSNEYRHSSYYQIDDYRTNENNLLVTITKHNKITYTSKIEDWNKVNKYTITANDVLKEWQPNTSYYVNNCIIYENRIYVCIHKHISGDTFNYNNFSLLSDIQPSSSINGWLQNKLYEAQDLVLYENSLYMCTTKHYSNNFINDINNWNLLRGHNPIANSSIKLWQEYNEYLMYDVVLFNNDFYVCTKDTNNFSNFKKYIYDDSKSILLWDKNVHYYPDNLVIKNDMLYICLQEHVSHDFIDESDYWKILSTNGLIGLEEWLPKNEYYYKDVVIYDNELYSCTENHISDSNFLGDYDYWQKLTNFQMFFHNSKLNAWSRDHLYKVSDFVAYNGNLYQCVEEHTSSALFTDDILYWDSLTDLSNGTRVQVWTSKQVYNKNDLVIYNNDLYICSGTHVSSNFYTDIYYWHSLMGNNNIKVVNWMKDYNYKEFDLTIYNNYIYCCVKEHLSDDFINDYENWTLIGNVNGKVNNYIANHNYHIGDIIIQNGIFYLCIRNYTSPNIFIYDRAYWEKLNLTCEDIELNKTYSIGDLVFYDSYVYKCIVSHTATYFISDNWQKLMTDGSYLKNTKIDLYLGKKYKVGDIIVYNDVIYECIKEHTANKFNESNWLLVNNSILYKWKRNYNYVLNDCVIYDGNIYRCMKSHLSNIFISDIMNWECLTGENVNIIIWNINTSYSAYDLVLHDNTLYVCLKNHISSNNFELDNEYWGKVVVPDIFYEIDDEPLSDEEILKFRNTLLMYIDLYGENIAYTMFKEEYWKYITSLNNENVYFEDGKLI